MALLRGGMDRATLLVLLLLGAIVVVFGVRVIGEARRVQEADKVQRSPVVLATDPVRGNPFAAVTLIEYGDFQCPFCQREQTALKALLSRYPDTLRIVWKDFPLSEEHPEAEAAAEAARCADEQGKFWEMHDALFTNQRALASSLYLTLAGQLGLDTDRFVQCMAGDTMLERISTSISDGQLAGVDGTPYYFFNGQRTTQLPSTEELDQFMKQF